VPFWALPRNRERSSSSIGISSQHARAKSAPTGYPDHPPWLELHSQRYSSLADRQMALAGLRLAKLLNDTLGRMTPADFK
jgi:hypothetical protein